MNVEKLRELFPVTKELVYLNNAAQTPLNILVRRRLEEYLVAAEKSPDKRPSPRHAIRSLLSQILGGEPQEYALVHSTGLGIGMVAAGYPWQAGDNVVVPVNEHWNNTYPWLALRDKGIDVRLVPTEVDNRIDPETVAKYVDEKTRIVAIAAVRHQSGFRVDLKKVSAIAHAKGALCVVDGIQAAGAVPMNVEADDIDILAGAGFKWLLGIHGTGFLYVKNSCLNRIQPMLPGMFSAEDRPQELVYFPDSRRYETGTMAYALFHAWTAGLELVLKIGVDAIHKLILDLTDQIITGLQQRNVTLLTPINNRMERSAIVGLSVGTPEENKKLQQRLEAESIVISLRGGNCRVSPAFFTTEEEIDRFLQAL